MIIRFGFLFCVVAIYQKQMQNANLKMQPYVLHF